MKFIIALVFCIFIGILGISLGGGTAYPPINRVAEPFVCADGEMTAEREFTNVRPGETYIEASWVCVDSSGEATPINKWRLCAYAGTIYGVGLFLLFGLLALLRGGKGGKNVTPPPAAT